MGCNVSSGGCNAVDAAMLLYAGSARTAAAQAQQQKSLDLLWKLTHGTIWETQTDAQEAYQKSVPSGAVAAEIGSIGGRTVVWNQTLTNYHFATTAAITGIRSSISAADNKLTVVSTTSNTSFGVTFGTSSDYVQDHKYLVVFMLEEFHGNESKAWAGFLDYPSVNLTGGRQLYAGIATMTGPYGLQVGLSNSDGVSVGDSFILSWAAAVDLTLMFGAGNEPASTSDPRIDGIIAYAQQHPERDVGTLLSAAVTSVVSKGTDDETLDTLVIPAAVRALEGYGQSEVSGDGNTLNLSAGTFTEVGHYVDGVWTPLETPAVRDISAMLTGNMMSVEAGGTLTFVQDGTELQVPSSVEYLIKISEVTE